METTFNSLRVVVRSNEILEGDVVYFSIQTTHNESAAVTGFERLPGQQKVIWLDDVFEEFHLMHFATSEAGNLYDTTLVISQISTVKVKGDTMSISVNLYSICGNSSSAGFKDFSIWAEHAPGFSSILPSGFL